MKCSYPNCKYEVMSNESDGFCLAHAPIESKLDHKNEFNNFIMTEKLHKHDLNFDGIRFPWGFDYLDNQVEISHSVMFQNCDFNLLQDEKYAFSLQKKQPQLNLKQSIDFKNCHFNGDVKINGVYFYSTLNFHGIKGEPTLEISSTDFDKGLKINSSRIGGLNIEGGILKNELSLIDSDLLGGMKLHCDENKYSLNIKCCKISHELVTSNNVFENKIFIDASDIQKAQFDKSKFLQEILFREVTFHDDANFRNCEFQQRASFSGARFKGRTEFSYSNFKNKVFLSGCRINHVDFRSATFEDECTFFSSRFYGMADFLATKFSGRTSFAYTNFLKTKNIIEAQKSYRSDYQINFDETIIEDQFLFFHNKINCRFIFNMVRFGKESKFNFSETITFSSARIIFNYIQFNHASAIFDKNGIKYKQDAFRYAFRYCILNDVYFTNNNLSTFSFYTSIIDKARFISSSWLVKSKRTFFTKKTTTRNIIFEDLFLSYVKKLTKKEQSDLKYILMLKDLSISAVQNLYQHFKGAYDNSKNYEEAGIFYFNENEMKRKISKVHKNYLKFTLLTIYKIFAGYGEKPGWSSCWFGIITLLFTILNLMTGIEVKGDKIINYNFDFNFSLHRLTHIFSSSFWSEIGFAFAYSINRIIPLNYLSVEKNILSPVGWDGIVLSFLNTIVLLGLIFLIGIGIQRIVRRF